jgi:hypothetical protein
MQRARARSSAGPVEIAGCVEPFAPRRHPPTYEGAVIPFCNIIFCPDRNSSQYYEQEWGEEKWLYHALVHPPLAPHEFSETQKEYSLACSCVRGGHN